MKKFKVKVDLSGSAYFSEDDQPVKTSDVVQAMKKARAVDVAANILLIVKLSCSAPSGVDNFDKIKTAS